MFRGLTRPLRPAAFASYSRRTMAQSTPEFVSPLLLFGRRSLRNVPRGVCQTSTCLMEHDQIFFIISVK